MADPRSSGGEGTESTLGWRSSDAKGLAYVQVGTWSTRTSAMG